MPEHTTTLTSPTGRIRLVPPSPADDHAVCVIRTSPRTRLHLLFLPEIMTVDEARMMREERADDPRVMGFNIHLHNDDNSYSIAGMTGMFSIDRGNSSCEVGILVHPDAHGNGVATEALYTLLKYIFEQEKFHRVTFEVEVHNIPMLTWLDSVAKAKLEATRREFWKNADGSYSNVMGYSILEQEWNGHAKLNMEKRLRYL